MRFDWEAFCRRSSIPFISTGPRTVKGNISIRCPFCGAADHSEHMGLSLDPHNPVWGCLRDARHRGRDPARLVARLLNIHLAQAEVLVAHAGRTVDEFDRAIENLHGAQQTEEPAPTPQPVQWPKEIRPLTLDGGRYAQPFLRYLRRRGFAREQDLTTALDVCGLRYALTGEQAYRIVFPIRDHRDRLVGWTGRSILDGASLRYKAMSGVGKDVLLCLGRPARSMVAVEGPFDALKVAVAGRPLGLFAAAVMGAAVTQAQTVLLRELAASVDRTFVLFDADAVSPGIRLSDEIAARWTTPPAGVKDPGEMSVDGLREFLRNLLRG